MMFDSKHLGLVDAAIAMEIAEKIDNGQPKKKLADSLQQGLARIWRRGAEVAKYDKQMRIPSTRKLA